MAARLLDALVPALIWTSGGIGVQLLLPRPLERSWTARLALGFLIGCAGTAMLAWWTSFLLGVSLSARLYLAFPLATLIAGGAVALRRGDAGGLAPAMRRSGGPRRSALLVPAVVLGVASGSLLLNALVEPVIDFDGRMTWGTAAKYLEAEGRALPTALTDPTRYVIHPRYPIVMPLLQAGAVRLGAGEIEGAGVRPLYVLFLPALLLVLAPTVFRRAGRWPAVVVLALLASAPGLLWEREIGARGTFSDLPLGAFLGAGLMVLLHPRLPDEPWRGWVAGLLLAAAAGTKNEGLLLAPAAVLAAGLAWHRHHGGARRAARLVLRRALLLAALAVALTALWASRIPNRNDEEYLSGLSLRTAVEGLSERVGELSVRIGRQALDPKRSGALFWVLPLLLLSGGRALAGRLVTGASALIAFELALIGYAYSVVSDLTVVDVTWIRFVLQLYAPLAIVLAALLRGVWSAARRRELSGLEG